MAEELPEQYREPFSESFPIRRQQHLELNAFLDRLIQESEDRSLVFFDPDFSGVDAYERSLAPFREQFHRMLGYPPPKFKREPVPRSELVGRDKVSDVYRMWTEVMEGVDVYGIYMVPRNLKGKAPLLIAQHGGSGCPEAICDLDTRINYHSFGPEAVKSGYIVWAPFVLMHVSYGGDPAIEEDRHFLDRKARLVGTSVVGIEVHKIVRGLEAILRARPEVDAERVGMVGLSYGGYYTLYTMAASPMIKAGVCSGFFHILSPGVNPVKGSDRRFFNIMNTFGLVQTVGLICPRPLMIQNGREDPVIPIEGARRAAPMAASYYQKLGIEDRFTYFEHPGGHEFHNESILDFFGRHLGSRLT